MKIVAKRLICFLLVVLLSACAAKEPEGPAEQIGKGLDMITKGLQGIDTDLDSVETPIQREERRRREAQEKEEGKRSYESIPERDPYYDSPRYEPKPQDKGDWSSERRY